MQNELSDSKLLKKKNEFISKFAKTRSSFGPALAKRFRIRSM